MDLLQGLKRQVYENIKKAKKEIAKLEKQGATIGGTSETDQRYFYLVAEVNRIKMDMIYKFGVSEEEFIQETTSVSEKVMGMISKIIKKNQ